MAVDPAGRLVTTGGLVRAAGDVHELSILDTSGNELWSTNLPDSTGTFPSPAAQVFGAENVDLGVAPNGDIVTIVGNCLARFDASGNLLWVKALPENGFSNVAVDKAGNVVVLVVNTTPLIPKADLLRYNPAGQLLWDNVVDEALASQPTNQNYPNYEPLAIDDGGNIYVSLEGKQISLEKYSPDGVLLWQSVQGGGAWLAVTPDGTRLYSVGMGLYSDATDTLAGPIALTALDGNLGTVQWTTTIAATADPAKCSPPMACDVAVQPVSVAISGGNAIISGLTQGIAAGQTDISSTTGGAAAVVASIDPDGHVRWVHQYNRTGGGDTSFGLDYVGNVASAPGGPAFLFIRAFAIAGAIYQLPAP